MQLEQLNCRNCGAPISPQNFVEHLAMARCGHCDSVFSVASHAAFGRHGQPLERPQVELPHGMQVSEQGGELEIRRRWFTWGILFLAFFACFWNGFLIVWHTLAIVQGAWFMSLFGVIHTAVGVGLAYSVLTGFLNSTVVRVGRGSIEVKHGPLPWRGNKTILSHDIEQLYCREKISQGKNGASYRYAVLVVQQGRREVLLKGLENVEQALYIEQEIERFLKINDTPVVGEIPR
ncbi:MAG: hypothetical protein WD030_09615 [Pirellulales bacterium]